MITTRVSNSIKQCSLHSFAGFHGLPSSVAVVYIMTSLPFASFFPDLTGEGL